MTIVDKNIIIWPFQGRGRTLAWERVLLPESTLPASGDITAGSSLAGGKEFLGGKNLKRAHTELQLVPVSQHNFLATILLFLLFLYKCSKLEVFFCFSKNCQIHQLSNNMLKNSSKLDCFCKTLSCKMPA